LGVFAPGEGRRRPRSWSIGLDSAERQAQNSAERRRRELIAKLQGGSGARRHIPGVRVSLALIREAAKESGPGGVWRASDRGPWSIRRLRRPVPPHNHRQAARQRRGGLRVPGRDRPPRRSDREEEILKAAGMAALALGLQGYAGINLVVGGLPRIVDVNHHLLRLAGRMMASIPFSTSSTKTHPSTIFPSFCTW